MSNNKNVHGDLLNSEDTDNVYLSVKITLIESFTMRYIGLKC